MDRGAAFGLGSATGPAGELVVLNCVADRAVIKCRYEIRGLETDVPLFVGDGRSCGRGCGASDGTEADVLWRGSIVPATGVAPDGNECVPVFHDQHIYR